MLSFFSPNVLRWSFISIISFLWISILVGSYDNGSFHWGELMHGAGEIGWKLLIFTIFISLFQKLIRMHFPKCKIFSLLLPLRKYSGVFAFLLVATHAFAHFAKKGVDFFSLDQVLSEAFTTHHAVIFGTISFLIMLPLFITSTDWAMKKMGTRSWKNLQRFTHVAFIFAGLHIMLVDYFGQGKIEFGPLVLFALYAVGYAYLFFRKRAKKGEKRKSDSV